MNRVLKQRFNQISRQNNYLYTNRAASANKVESPVTKLMPARPVLRPEPTPSDFRRA
ncbi:MAG TPA: hypothetical protein PKC67_03495 [Kiritimatiellia bacterium]|nr:hypothetical protein [Kiritimatiellia bacterium]HMP33391.1 hypothetical protein [Kiritimatiellia bacterium]